MRGATLALAVVLGATGVRAADAAGTPGARCAASKVDAGGKRAAAALQCHAQAVVRGAAADAACLTRAEGSFDDAYASAEAKGGCLMLGDAAATGATIEAHLATIVAAIPGGATSPSRRCASRKLRAAGKKVRGEAACHRRALRDGASVDARCLAKVEGRFTNAFAGADAGGGCPGSADDVETLADDLLEALLAASPTVTIPTSSTSTTTMVGGTTTTTTLVPCAGGAGFPVCDGGCPSGAVCAPDTETFSSCKCVFDGAPCGDTYPVCGGVCSTGQPCRQTGVVPVGTCTCESPGTVCGDGPYPTCGGACGAGVSCFPTDTVLFGMPFLQCECGSPAPCGSGGLACPPGFVCAGEPGLRLCVPIL